jgi:threonine synthase
MKFTSTRNTEPVVTFEEAVFTGLAPDGGLFHPTGPPDFRDLFRSLTPHMSFVEVATRVTTALFPEDFVPKVARILCKKAFTFSPEFRSIDENITILELFHGPSCAFKDFGASFLASSMEYFLTGRKRRAVILTATSGDTGSAVAKAFHGRENIDVVILYPSGRVSPLQEKQLTTVGDNVTALEVMGTFDDCQRMVKEAFVDPDLRKLFPLTSANSINLGRLIPQAFYYIFAWAHLQGSYKEILFSVPSGNFGNLTAGVLAWEWGLPVKKFIAATNINDVVPEYLRTKAYTPRPSIQTFSNAMDVGDPSNFERLQAIFNNSWEEMQAQIDEEVITDRETLDTIRSVYKDKNIFLDPHTAVGYLATKRFFQKNRDKLRGSHIITLATAHPGKFLEIVEEATGTSPELPDRLVRAMKLPKYSVEIENSKEALATFLRDRFG